MKNFDLDVLIVEDSLSYAIELERVCESLGLTVIAIVDSSAEALDTIYAQGPDFILMDVNINGKLTGVELGQKISHLDIPIVYITSMNDEETKAKVKQSNMAGYMEKPITVAEIEANLSNILSKGLLVSEDGDFTMTGKQENQSKNTLLFKDSGSYYKIDLSKIEYIRSEDNYCRFVGGESKDRLVRITMSEVEKLVKSVSFGRCHRSYLVNLKSIVNLDATSKEIELISGAKVPLSRTRKQELLDLWQDSMS